MSNWSSLATGLKTCWKLPRNKSTNDRRKVATHPVGLGRQGQSQGFGSQIPEINGEYEVNARSGAVHP